MIICAAKKTNRKTKEKIMTDYNHVLLVSSETAEKLSDEIITHAGAYGVAVVVNDENGLTPLSKDFVPEEVSRLNAVLPKGVDARKANGILHKLSYRVKNTGSDKSLAISKENSAIQQR